MTENICLKKNARGMIRWEKKKKTGWGGVTGKYAVAPWKSQGRTSTVCDSFVNLWFECLIWLIKEINFHNNMFSYVGVSGITDVIQLLTICKWSS